MYEIYHKSMSYASSGTPLLKFSHLIQTLAFRQKRDGPCPNSKLEFLKLYAVITGGLKKQFTMKVTRNFFRILDSRLYVL